MTEPHANMTPGKVYRTRELAAFSANPTRWAKRLTDQGVLRQAAHGMYYLPLTSRFGPVPPSEHETLRAFLGDDSFLVTGSPVWNALDLGMTGQLMVTLVYNPYRTGEFTFAGGRYWLRRVRYPRSPSPEWFVVDAFENHAMVGADQAEMLRLLALHLRAGRFDAGRLRQAVAEFASPPTRSILLTVLADN